MTGNTRVMGISFERAFGIWQRVHFYPRMHLAAPGSDIGDHNCGWTVRPNTVELVGGYRIKCCYGCGACWQISPAPLD